MKQHLKQELTHFLASLPEDERVEAINEFRQAIHKVSPFREEPVAVSYTHLRAHET